MIGGDFIIRTGIGQMVIDKADVVRALYDIEGNLFMVLQGFDVNEIYKFLDSIKGNKFKINNLYYHDGKNLSGYYTIDKLTIKGESDKKIEVYMQRRV